MATPLTKGSVRALPWTRRDPRDSVREEVAMNWPDNDGTVNALEAVRHIFEAVRGLPYQGLPHGEFTAATAVPAERTFAPEVLAAVREAGATKWEAALLLAFQLGIEQGRRLAMRYVKLGEAPPSEDPADPR